MAAKHKFSGAHVVISTNLTGDEAARIAKSVGEGTKGDIRIGLNHVRFEGAQQGRLNFSIRALKDVMEFMTFHVDITPSATGSQIRSSIDGFKTKQQKLFMLIPIAPKRMLAYKTYSLFMRNLEQAFAAADASAQTSITERVAAR